MKNILYFILAAIVCILAACSMDSDFGSELNGEGKSGSITKFTIHNGYMYALNPNEVQTYDLQNPDEPELVNTIETDYGLETIIIYDNTVYVGSRSSLYILNISVPYQPEILAQSNRIELGFFSGCDPVVVKDNYAYSTVKVIDNVCGNFDTQSLLLVYDVSNKSEPKVVGEFFLDAPNGLAYIGNNLIVCDEGSDELLMFDISEPTNVQPLINHNISITDPVDLIIHDSKMIVSTKTSFHIYNINSIADINQTGIIPK